MVGCMYYIQQTVSKHKEELQSEPLDEEVAELENKEQRLQQQLKLLTEWKVYGASHGKDQYWWLLPC